MLPKIPEVYLEHLDMSVLQCEQCCLKYLRYTRSTWI